MHSRHVVESERLGSEVYHRIHETKKKIDPCCAGHHSIHSRAHNQFVCMDCKLHTPSAFVKHSIAPIFPFRRTRDKSSYKDYICNQELEIREEYEYVRDVLKALTSEYDFEIEYSKYRRRYFFSLNRGSTELAQYHIYRESEKHNIFVCTSNCTHCKGLVSRLGDKFGKRIVFQGCSQSKK